MRQLSPALCAALALGLSSATAAVAAPTGSSGVSGDVRCLMTMAALTSSKDAKQAQLAAVGVAYFTGRVKAQDPSFNFNTRLKPVAAEMGREALVAEAKRCGPMLTAALRELDGALKTISGPQTAAAPGGAAKSSPAKPAAKPTAPPKP